MGRPPDLVPNENEAAWQVPEAGWLYIVGDSARAGEALVTLIVDDLDALVGDLDLRGIACGEIETIPDAARKAEVTDPDGNSITFGQPLSG